MRQIGILLVTGTLVLAGLAGFSKVENARFHPIPIQPLAVSDTTSGLNTSIQSSDMTGQKLYDSLQLNESGLSWEAFQYAWIGFKEAGFVKPIMAIADFSQSSRNKRLYVIDFQNQKILLNTYVAHGRNSGEEFARKFSNTNSSYQSSLGFYRALGTYQGKHGLSLRLQGLEKNINDLAQQRAIVMHGADYVSEEFIRQTGRLGRSLGCPAVSNADHKSLIELLKNGAGIFLYSPDATYLSSSKLLQKAIAHSQLVPFSQEYTSSK